MGDELGDADPSSMAQLPMFTDGDRRGLLFKRITEEGGFAFLRSAKLADTGDLRAAEEAQEMAWEQLHSGPWHEVVSSWRDAYAMACLHVAEIRTSAGEFQEALRVLDLGLIMGGLLFRGELDAAVEKIAAMSATAEVEDNRRSNVQGFENSYNMNMTEVLQVLPSRSLKCIVVERQPSLSLEVFVRDYFLRRNPIIISNCIDHWPARKKWKDADYLKRIAGDRTVPVEIQELRNDIMIPDYCYAGGGELQSLNAWFGPLGTVTPLHHDPHHNIFAQVVGRKYVRLYPESSSQDLYPHIEPMLTNSSQVDLDNFDAAKFPKAANLGFVDCILEEGELLYIPPRWWHYVRSLSTSFSVSFWWSAASDLPPAK